MSIRVDRWSNELCFVHQHHRHRDECLGRAALFVTSRLFEDRLVICLVLTETVDRDGAVEPPCLVPLRPVLDRVLAVLPCIPSPRPSRNGSV